jgi:septum formation protein
MGLDFDIVPSNFEEYLDDIRSPRDVAIELGLGKANDVAKDYPNSYVIGSDVIIVVDGKQLAKPESPAEARYMLKLLSGRSHQAITSVAVVNLSKNVEVTDAETVDVVFQHIPDEIIEAYIATGDPYDKAAGYARQHPLLKPFITLDGELHAHAGISTMKLRRILEKLGLPVPNDAAKTIELFEKSSLADQRILN